MQRNDEEYRPDGKNSSQQNQKADFRVRSRNLDQHSPQQPGLDGRIIDHLMGSPGLLQPLRQAGLIKVCPQLAHADQLTWAFALTHLLPGMLAHLRQQRLHCCIQRRAQSFYIGAAALCRKLLPAAASPNQRQRLLQRFIQIHWQILMARKHQARPRLIQAACPQQRDPACLSNLLRQEAQISHLAVRQQRAHNWMLANSARPLCQQVARLAAQQFAACLLQTLAQSRVLLEHLARRLFQPIQRRGQQLTNRRQRARLAPVISNRALPTEELHPRHIAARLPAPDTNPPDPPRPPAQAFPPSQSHPPPKTPKSKNPPH